MKKLFTFCILICCILAQEKIFAQLEFIGSEDYGVLTNFLYDPDVENRIYASTRGNHLMISEDNGTTWEVLYSFPNLNRPVEIMQMKFTDNYNSISFYEYYGGTPLDKVSIFDLTTKTIVKQYTLPNATFDNVIRSYSIFDNNTDIILMHSVINFTHHTIFYTNDGGMNWSTVYNSDLNFNVMIENVRICQSNPSKLYMTRSNGSNSQGTEGGLWISLDAGQTWNETLSGLMLHAIGIHPTNPDDIYVGSGFRVLFPNQDQALYRSLDGGNTWATMPITWDGGWGFGSYDFVTQIIHNPANPNSILVLEENEIVISKDNGTTWQSFVQPGIPDIADYWYGLGATFNPYNENEVFIYDYSYPLHSLDGAQTISIYPNIFYRSTGDVNLFVSTTEQHLYHGVQWGYIHKNLNTGIETATDVQLMNNEYIGGPPLIRTFLDHQTAGRIFSFTGNFMYGYHLSVSDDHNQNKNQIYNTSLQYIYALEVDPFNANTIWASISDGNQNSEFLHIDFNNLNNVLISHITQPVPGVINGIAIHPNDPDTILISLDHQVYKTIDGGINWTVTNSGLGLLDPSDNIFSLEKNPLNSNQFTITSTKGVFTTYDSGGTWQQLTSNPMSVLKHSNENPDHIAGAFYSTFTSDYRLYYSGDSGTSWQVIMPNELHYTVSNSTAFRFYEDSIEAYIASRDLGLIEYKIDMGSLSTDNFYHHTKNDFTIYPNPSDGLVQIQGNQDISNVKVYNLTGQIVMETFGERELNTSNLVQGMYLVQIETVNGSLSTLKLIKK